jgi:uncharacterized membrane protein YgdD (TMEM256/DUF423 family)
MGMERLWLTSAAVHGFLAVALGAFGAHGLKSKLAALVDGTDRLGWWQTAAQYHLAHALAFGLVAYVTGRFGGNASNVSGALLHAGIVLFSGSLYVMALTGTRALGVVTPLGGLCLLGAWLALGLASFR